MASSRAFRSLLIAFRWRCSASVKSRPIISAKRNFCCSIAYMNCKSIRARCSDRSLEALVLAMATFYASLLLV